MANYLDETDRHIIHALMDDARHTTATMIAEDLNVSDGTVRNRIERLEQEGVIQGYTAMIDFEKAGQMKAVFICTAPGAERERLALAVQSIPGVIHVRVLMLGRPDLQVVAVGEDTKDLRRIAESLSELDIDIEDEELVQTEMHSPYEPFGTVTAGQLDAVGRIELVGNTDMLEFTVDDGAPVVGRSVQQLREEDVLADDATLISVERAGEIRTPNEELVVETGDVLTVLPRTVSDEAVIEAFLGAVPDEST
jgi:DNA-binding Lrp family transcriptional regulator